MGHPFATLLGNRNSQMLLWSSCAPAQVVCGTSRRNGRCVCSHRAQSSRRLQRRGGTAPVAGMVSQRDTHCSGGTGQEHSEVDLTFTWGNTWHVMSSVSGWVTREVRTYGSGQKSWLGRATQVPLLNSVNSVWVFAPGHPSRRSGDNFYRQPETASQTQSLAPVGEFPYPVIHWRGTDSPGCSWKALMINSHPQ